MKKKIHPVVRDAVLELRKDTEALKKLADLEEIVDVPVQRGGVYFTDWERGFIKGFSESARDTADRANLSPAQRDKIAEVWHAVDLRKRGMPDDGPENLFSKLSPARQAEQRAAAAKVKFPWEK